MPYPNEHSARLREPGDFAKAPKWKDGKPGQFRRTRGSGKGTVQGVKIPATISIIWGKLKGKAGKDDPPIAQALRFPTKDWTESQARAWLRRHKIKYRKFEPATKAGKGE